MTAFDRVLLGTLGPLLIATAGATVQMCRSMAIGMPMPGGWTMSMAWMTMPGQTRLAAGAAFMTMWIVMMTAMMLPSLTPMLRRYRPGSDRPAAAAPAVLAALAGAAYLLVWIAVGVAAYAIGAAAAAAEMQS